MASYTTMIAGKTTAGSIKNWVNRSDIPATTILTEAQALIYTKLRVREMQVRDDLTLLVDTSQAALPSDFLDPVSFIPYGWGEPMSYLDETRFQQHMDEDGNVFAGTPSSFTIIGTLMVFDAKAEEQLSGKLIYYAKPAFLATPTPETNFLTERYPTMLRHACLSFAYEHMKDEQRSLDYRKKAEAEAAELSERDDLYRRGQF